MLVHWFHRVRRFALLFGCSLNGRATFYCLGGEEVPFDRAKFALPVDDLVWVLGGVELIEIVGELVGNPDVRALERLDQLDEYEDGFEVARELEEALGILFVVPLAVAKFWNDALGSERPGTCIGDVGPRGPMEDVHRVDSMNSRGASWKSLVRDNVKRGCLLYTSPSPRDRG